MVTVEALETFLFKDYDKVEIITKKTTKANEFAKGDRFKCDNDIAKYLCGENPLKRAVVQVIEVEPEKPKVEKAKPEEPKTQETTEKPKKKKIDKKTK